jgi:hypothetical protein
VRNSKLLNWAVIISLFVSASVAPAEPFHNGSFEWPGGLQGNGAQLELYPGDPIVVEGWQVGGTAGPVLWTRGTNNVITFGPIDGLALTWPRFRAQLAARAATTPRSRRHAHLCVVSLCQKRTPFHCSRNGIVTVSLRGATPNCATRRQTLRHSAHHPGCLSRTGCH